MYDPSEAAAHAAEAARDRRDEENKARAKAAMEGDIIVADRPAPNHYAPTKLANGASDKSVDRLVRSSRIMYGDQPTEAKVREWAAGQTQRAVSDRISAIEAMPGFQAKRAAASAQKPAQRQQSALGKLPEGRYAIDHDGHWRFFKVDKPTEGRWQGYTFLTEGVGGEHGDLIWHRMGRDRRDAAAEALLATDLKQAAIEYGQRIGECGVCGRSLSNDHKPGKDGLTSIQRGIGPVCMDNQGWW